MLPDLRIEKQGRIVEPALGRAAPMAGLGDLALAPLPARSQAVESVVAGIRLGRCLPACGCGVTGRGLVTAIGRFAFALARCLGETGRGPWSRRDRSRRDRLRSSDRCRSRRKRTRSLLVGEVDVTARGHGCGHLFPLTVRGQRVKAGEPDVSNGRVWRQ